MPRLLFLMTPGNGLITWKKIGSIDRELKPFHEYRKRGWKVTVGTFDTRGDRFDEGIGLDMAYCLSPRLLFALPWSSFRRVLRSADVIRTNQSTNVWWYVFAARVCRKAILLRCGNVAGEMRETIDGPTLRTRLYQRREGWAFRNATMCTVPSEALKAWVCERYRVPESRVAVMPNFVDTEVFHPDPESVPASRSVVYVGRIHPKKNCELLVRACAQAGASVVTYVGTGPDEEKVRRLASEIGIRVELAGRVPNAQLPGILRKHMVYVQPSQWEGQCKSLMEAMACGMACVGTDVPGTRDSIRHEKTGLLCPSEPRAMASAIRRFFDDESLRRRLGTNAAAFVRSEYSFERVFEREYSIVSTLAGVPTDSTTSSVHPTALIGVSAKT